MSKKLEVDPKEAPIRRRLYELIREHKRKKTVARILNQEGLRTRNGSKFSDTTVDGLLRDETAKGWRLTNYTKTANNKKAWVLKPESEWIRHLVEAIVSEELWDECNALLNRRVGRERPARKAVHLFAGLVYCGCGGKMSVPSNSPKYVCPSCRNKMPADELETMFREQLHDFFTSPDEVAEHLAQANVAIQEKEEFLDVLEAERAKLTRDIDTLYDLYQSQVIDKTGEARNCRRDHRAHHRRGRSGDHPFLRQAPRILQEVADLKVMATRQRGHNAAASLKLFAVGSKDPACLRVRGVIAAASLKLALAAIPFAPALEVPAALSLRLR